MWPRRKFAAVSMALVLLIIVWKYGMFQTGDAGRKMNYEAVQHTVNYPTEAFASELSRSYYEKFSKLMSTWPKNKPKAAIYILINSINIDTRLIGALQRLDRYFTARFNYPVILFHEENSRPHIPRILNCSNVSLFFQEVSFHMPPFIPENYTRKHCNYFQTGYRHMCRFHSKLVYKQPIMQLLDYAWRLDDDSEILSPIEFDVFAFMRDNGIEYGYKCLLADVQDCVFGLWEAAREYISNNDISTTYFSELPKARMYYNNFELSKVSFWTSKAYQGYIDYIDKLGGIYYNRWGDAPIKTIGLSLFMEKNKTHQFKNIAYKHTSYVDQGQ